MKATKITFWALTLFFCLMMLMDGISGVLQVDGGKAPMIKLGYPIYLMTILGLFKIAGALSILQTKFITLKEWAYAGFTLNYLGAAMSWIAIGEALNLVFPVIALAIMFLTYYFWKRYLRLPSAKHAIA
jgi:hypothetical protein